MSVDSISNNPALFNPMDTTELNSNSLKVAELNIMLSQFGVNIEAKTNPGGTTEYVVTLPPDGTQITLTEDELSAMYKLFTSPEGEQLLALLSENSELVGQLLENKELLALLGESPEFLQAVVENPSILVNIAENPGVLDDIKADLAAGTFDPINYAILINDESLISSYETDLKNILGG